MSKAERELVRAHLSTLLDEAHEQGIPDDTLGRLLLEAVIDIWSRERSLDDIGSELSFTAENLDPDMDYAFMRP
jgi:hypothetical protein